MKTARCTWLSVAPAPPRRWDLTSVGWHVIPRFRAVSVETAFQVVLDWRIGFRCQDWLDLRGKHRVMVLGVEEPGERVRLLNLGFGAVLHHDTPLGEVASRLASMQSFFGGTSAVQSSHSTHVAPRLDLPLAMTQTGEAHQLRIPVHHEPCRARYH